MIKTKYLSLKKKDKENPDREGEPRPWERGKTFWKNPERERGDETNEETERQICYAGIKNYYLVLQLCYSTITNLWRYCSTIINFFKMPNRIMRCFCVLMVKYIYVWHMVVTSAGVSVLIGLVLTCFIGALKTYALLAHLLITLFLFIWQVICS